MSTFIESPVFPETIEEYIHSYSPLLIDILKGSTACVSGSTALYYYMKQIGMSPTFKPGDLDIYHTNRSDCDTKSIGKWRELNYWFDTEFREMDDFEKTLFRVSCYSGKILGHLCPEHVMKDIPENLKSIIKHVRSGLKNGKKVDLILIDDIYDGTPSDFIDTYFDFDFCKCYFNGTGIICNFPESVRTKSCVITTIPMTKFSHMTPMAYVMYIKNIQNKDCPGELTRETDPHNIFRRIIKYEERGFVFDFTGLKIDQDVLLRMLKYEAIKKLYSDINEINKMFCYSKWVTVNMDIAFMCNDEFKFIVPNEDLGVVKGVKLGEKSKRVEN
jgi:hypothetical protein